MRKSFAIGCLVLLAGCQTDAQVRSKPLIASYQSTKGADAAVTCLIPSLAKTWNGVAIQNTRFVAQTIAPGSEYDIVSTGGQINGHYTFTVNVRSASGGSTIALYRGQPMLPSLTDAMKAGILACL
jgi:hypothetical protein